MAKEPVRAVRRAPSRKAGPSGGGKVGKSLDAADVIRTRPIASAHDRSALIVLGMHRSGTSALTGVLRRLGAKGPKTVLPAAPDNPKGFEESSRFLDVHRRLLTSAGSSWVDWAPFNPDWIHSATAEPFRVELGQVFDEEFEGAGLVALKDPRICRFAPIWFEVLEAKRINALPIIAFRNPLEVAASLQARGSMPLMHGMLLWLRHVLDAEHASRGMVRAFIDHRKVLDDWRQVASDLRERFGLHWPRYSPSVEVEIDAWIDSSLRHQVSSESAALNDRKVAEWVRRAYASLLEVSEKGETSAALKAFDSIRIEFDRASQALGAFCHQYEAKATWSSGERQKAVAARQAAEAAAKSAQDRAVELEQRAGIDAEQLAKSEQASASLAAELAAARQASEARVKTLEAKIAEQQRQATEMADRLSASEQNADKLAKDLAAGEDASRIKVQSLEADLVDAARRNEALKIELAGAQSAAVEVAKQLEAQVELLQRSSMSLEEELAGARQESATLERELTAARQALQVVSTSLELQVTNLQAEASATAQELELAKQQARDLADELVQTKATADSLARSLEGRLKELQDAAVDALERLARTEEQTAKNLESEAARKQAYVSTIAMLEARVAELKSAARDAPDYRSRYQALTRVQLASEERIARLTAELQAAQREPKPASPKPTAATDIKAAEAKAAEGKPEANQPVAQAAAVAPQAPKVQAAVSAGGLSQATEAKPKLPVVMAKTNGAVGHGAPLSNGKAGASNGASPPHLNGDAAAQAPLSKLAHIETVRPFFDREFYLRRYPDIARALDRGTIKNGDPLTHYLEFGGKEKRDPNPWFSSEFYLSTHADVAKSGMNPLVHFVLTGQAEGRAHGAMSAGAPVFDAFSAVLGKSPKEAEALLAQRRGDLRERLKSGELGRMVERASELEPLVRHSTLAAIRAGITPFRNEGMMAQIVAIHRMQEAAGWKRAKAVVLIPWVHLSGATRIAGHLCHALAEIYGADEVVVIRTETSEFQFPEWFPAGCRHVDFAGMAERVRPESRLRLLVELLRSLCPAAVFNVNSRLMWEAMEPYGKALADTTSLYAYLFCNDKNVHGDWVGYPVRNFHRFFDEFAGVITDSRFLASSLQSQFHLPPAQQGKLVTLDTPADTNMQIAIPSPKKAGARPQVFWAGRFDRQKRVDIAYAIARSMPDIDFRMWGEAVLDKTTDRMKVPGNVSHEGVYQAFANLPLEECDAWLYTSEWDGVPNMLIEVAAAGIPLVGSLAGGTSDVLVDGLSHPIADIEDVDAYVRAIREVLAKPEDARAQAMKLRDKIYRERNSTVYLAAVRNVLPKQSLK